MKLILSNIILNRIGLTFNLIGAIFVAFDFIGLRRLKRFEENFRYFLTYFNFNNWYQFTQDKKTPPKVSALFLGISLIFSLGALIIFVYALTKFVIPNKDNYYFLGLWFDSYKPIIKYWLWIPCVIILVTSSYFIGRYAKTEKKPFFPLICASALLGLLLLPFVLVVIFSMLVFYFFSLLTVLIFFIFVRFFLLPLIISYWFKAKLGISSALRIFGIILLIVGYTLQIVATF